MPLVSLVVCVHKERDLLERLLHESAGCYDDLVVVHDGSEIGDGETAIAKPPAIDFYQLTSEESLPDGYRMPTAPARPESTQALVTKHGGRYFEGPRCFQQEPHWPFAWSRARHDWILRLDADEFPSEGLKHWLRAFRQQSADTQLSGYTCVWPLWDGRQTVTQRWPVGRSFLFHRERVKFIGMVELVPFPDGAFVQIEHVLHHQPKRKSYGIRNVLFRRQAFRWRRVIAQSLVGKPTDLPCWRWGSEAWPAEWEKVRMHPLRHSFVTLIRYSLQQARGMLRAGERPILSACLSAGLYHAMLGLRVFWAMRRRKSSS